MAISSTPSWNFCHVWGESGKSKEWLGPNWWKFDLMIRTSHSTNDVCLCQILASARYHRPSPRIVPRVWRMPNWDELGTYGEQPLGFKLHCPYLLTWSSAWYHLPPPFFTNREEMDIRQNPLPHNHRLKKLCVKFTEQLSGKPAWIIESAFLNMSCECSCRDIAWSTHIQQSSIRD